MDLDEIDRLSVVVHATLVGEDPVQLTDQELSFFFLLLFSAGSETTRKAIAGGLEALLGHPAELARLRPDPGLLTTAVEEIVRFCLGANLARLEIRVFFEELFARVGEMQVAGAPVWTRDNRLFGLKHLPLRLAALSARPHAI